MPAQFNGPARSANGGWVSGRLAGYLAPGRGGCVQVRLLGPPPLDTPMVIALDEAAGTAEVSVRGAAVLQAWRCGPDELAAAPGPVTARTALAAEASYPGRADHPFPTCFVCGPDRRLGDALRLSPGPVPGRRATSATTWTAPGFDADDDSGDGVPAAACWAALDCPGGWAVGLAGRPLVLGTMTAQLLREPTVGEPCVVVGAWLRTEGRKQWTSTGLYGADGELLGQATAVWIAIDPAAASPASS